MKCQVSSLEFKALRCGCCLLHYLDGMLEVTDMLSQLAAMQIAHHCWIITCWSGQLGHTVMQV